MSEKRLKLVGWGYEGEGLDEARSRRILDHGYRRYGIDPKACRPEPAEEAMAVPLPRLEMPAAFAAFATTGKRDRMLHTYGKSYPDYIRVFDGDFANAPDIVAYPRDEADIETVYDFAAGAGAAVIPFGGGTSVVGGVEPAVGDRYRGTISLDLTRLDQVMEIDKTSRAARIQGGMRVPALEAALKPHGLTLRHFPQSMALATVGGMVATRSGGHFATLYTHIDDFVESIRTLTPSGVMESRRLPGSGAGPSPDRFIIGSEGSLGVISETWLRLQDRPMHRGSAVFLYPDIEAAAAAVRAVAQAGLFPANLRLLDRYEAESNGVPTDGRAAVVLGFESADHPVEPWTDRAVELLSDHGGMPEEARTGGEAHREGIAGAWRDAFIMMPYARPLHLSMALINDTFETATTWDNFSRFHEGVRAATLQAIETATGQPGFVSCRFTHVYPDGPAPYFTFEGKGRPEELMQQWQFIKEKASDAVIGLGGTITHHHAVGRDHMPWYKRQRPALFGTALAAAKASLDPAGIMNPGVIVD